VGVGVGGGILRGVEVGVGGRRVRPGRGMRRCGA